MNKPITFFNFGLSIIVALLLFVPQKANGQIEEKAAVNILKEYYFNLNQYIENIQQKGDFSIPKSNLEKRFYNCELLTITQDYLFTESNDYSLTNKISPNSYLINLQKLIQKENKYYIYYLKNTGTFKKLGGDTTQISCSVLINKVKCVAKFKFKNESILSITVVAANENPIISCSHVNFSAGWKIANGFNLGFGIDGISKNWFINHLRFGVEYNILFNQERDAHYPTSTDGTPATMTYRTRENDDYGLGINIGYRIIPGKYDNISIFGDPGRLFLSMGGGIARYGRWWEYQGTSEPIEHPRNTAFYIKPSVTLEYLLSDFWGIGVEASYYYSPQYSQINGVGINAIINYAF